MAIAIPVAILAAKLFQGWLSHKSDEQKADAAQQAAVAKLKAETDAWNVGEDRRVGSLNAIQGLEQRVQPFLRSGPGGANGSGPDYSFDPKVLTTLQEKKPYPGSLPPDPHAGLTTGAIGSAAGSVGDALLSYYAAQYGGGGGGIAGSALMGGPNAQPQSGSFGTVYDSGSYNDPGIPGGNGGTNIGGYDVTLPSSPGSSVMAPNTYDDPYEEYLKNRKPSQDPGSRGGA